MSMIMIVDDAKFIRMRVSKFLAKQGYTITEAGDGDEAVQNYRQLRPDLVLMDITMPGKDGLTALAEIRNFDPQARVIMFTALGQQALVLEAMQTGAKDFLVKPFDPEQMIKTLQKALG